MLFQLMPHASLLRKGCLITVREWDNKDFMARLDTDGCFEKICKLH